MAQALVEKLVRRHPHVFPAGRLRGVVDVQATDEDGIVATADYTMILLGENKPIAIQYLLGTQPILAVGNSNGDIGMLKDMAVTALMPLAVLP